MLNLEIVSHCWDYSRLLTYQLSSLVLYPPTKLQVTMSVFHMPEDERTVQVLKFFAGHRPNNVIWKWHELPKNRLVRRGIGRNIIALSTKADWIWFTDCDIVFRGCLDPLSNALESAKSNLLYPAEVSCNAPIDHRHTMMVKADKIDILDINTTDFKPGRPNRAMGPFQIARASALRDISKPQGQWGVGDIGYCNLYPKYLQPALDGFADRCPEDTKFRQTLGGFYYGTRIEIPGVFWIMHYPKGESNAPNSKRPDHRMQGEL